MPFIYSLSVVTWTYYFGYLEIIFETSVIIRGINVMESKGAEKGQSV
jgi:hypothetical protein